MTVAGPDSRFRIAFNLIQPSELKFRLLMQKIQIKKIYQMNTFSAENTTRTRAKIYYRRSRINSKFALRCLTCFSRYF